MKRTITALLTGFIALAASAGIPEEAEFIRTNCFTGIHGIFLGRLEEYAHEKGFSNDDLLERLKYISETHWDSEEFWTHHGAECAISTMGMLKMTNAVPYLENQLYRGGNRCAVALSALQDVWDYDENFLDILEKAVQYEVLPRLKATCILYGAVRRLSSESIALENKEKERIFRTLLLYPPDQGNLGLDADWHDNQLCRHMKDYARSKERLEQVALLAANTNASPGLREKYVKELEKMKAIPEDELVCLLDQYPPTENELALQRKEAAASRPDVSVAEAAAESPVVTANEQIESSSANRKAGLLVLAVMGGAVVCAIMLRRRRK